jgi:uncharacterized FlaG/YvyC family protein
MNDIYASKEQIEKNELNEDQLSSLINNLNEIKQKFRQNLNVSMDQINNFEKNFEFIPNKISNDVLFLGEIKVII